MSAALLEDDDEPMSMLSLDDMAWLATCLLSAVWLRQEIARALTPARKAALAVMAHHRVDVRVATRTSVDDASVAHTTAEWMRDRGLVNAVGPDGSRARWAVTGCRLELTQRGLDIVRSLGLDAR